MIRRTCIAGLFAASVAIVLNVGSAKAGLLPVSVTIQPEAGNFRWTYAVALPNNMMLQSGNYFTIYDFAGYVPGSGMVSATSPDPSYSAFWSLSSNMVGVTPPLLAPTDIPAIPNLTFTYSGPVIPNGHLVLGDFSAVSTSGTPSTFLFSSTNPATLTGKNSSNITETPEPTVIAPPPIFTPEPSALVLAGLGLPLIGLVRFVRRKKSDVA